MSDRSLTGFSPTAADHVRSPRNVGHLEGANAVGRIDDPATENLITIYLRVEGGRIAAASFRTFGCSACIAASSITTMLAQGREPVRARALDAGAILAALDGLPPDRLHCAELAARALHAALDDYEARTSG